MKTTVQFIAVALCLCVSAVAADTAPVAMRQARPAKPLLDRRQGWLTIANRDRNDYYLTADMDQARLFVSRQQNDGIRIASGGYAAVPLDRATWEVYGQDRNEKLEIRIRPGQESQLELAPGSGFDSSAVMAVSMSDGQRTSATLFGGSPAGRPGGFNQTRATATDGWGMTPTPNPDRNQDWSSGFDATGSGRGSYDQPSRLPGNSGYRDTTTLSGQRTDPVGRAVDGWVDDMVDGMVNPR